MAITFDYFNHIINITSPQTELAIQDLANAIANEEATVTGMSYPANSNPGIARLEGKIPKDDPPTVFSQIEIILYPPWQVQFWGGSGLTSVTGGSLTGGLNAVPIKATGTAGDITRFTAPVDGTLVQSQKIDETHGAVTGNRSMTNQKHIISDPDTSETVLEWDVENSSIPDGVTVTLTRTP